MPATMSSPISLRMRTIKGVCLFACLITVVAALASNLLVSIFFPAEIHEFVAPRAFWITLIITMPVCLYVGLKIRQNTALSDELVRLVNRDRLTDVATRDFFFQRMEKDQDAYGVSLMVDIDHFKRVNDTYGHYAGDVVIKRVSDILRAETRADDIICRFGGEEFVIFLHQVTGDQGLLVAERMRMSVEAENIIFAGEPLSVTVSIGGSLKAQLEDINISIQNADAALYRAKEGGRNRTVVDWLPSRLSDETRRAS